MSLSQKVAFNTAVQIISKIITVGFTLLTTILLTGYLGKEGYGDYIYVMTLAILFGSLADWGTLTIGVREVSKAKENQGQLLGNIFILRLLLSLLSIICLLVISFFLPLSKFIRIASPIILLVAAKASFNLIFQSQLKMQKAALSDIVASFLTFVFSWFVIRQGLGLGPLIWAIIWASLIALVVAAILALKTAKFNFTFDRKITGRIISESLPMGAILLMFTVDNKIDTVMLGNLKGSAAVGIYGLSSRVYDVLILGAAFLMNAMLPILSQMSGRKENQKLKAVFQKTFAVLLLAGLSLLIFIYLFSPLMIKVLTQKNFSNFFDSIGVLKIMGISLLIAYFNHLTGYTIVALGKQRTYFWIALGSLIFNILANWVMISRFSYWGASWVTVLTESLVLVATWTLLNLKNS